MISVCRKGIAEDEASYPSPLSIRNYPDSYPATYIQEYDGEHRVHLG